MSDEAVAALEALLRRERAALVAGDLSRIEQFAAQKLRLAQKIGSGQPVQTLQRLDEKLRHNAGLLAAAAVGLRDGIDRLRLLASPPPLRTYDGHGQSSALTPTARAFERRR